MKTSHNIVRQVAGVAGGLSIILFPLSFAFADLTLSINSLSPGSSVMAGQTLTFTAVGGGADSLSYFVFDSFANSSIGSSAINSASGTFSWTPAVQDNGIHTLSIEASDGKGLVKIINQVINVGSVSAQYSLSLQSLSPGNTVSFGQTVTFTAMPSGFSASAYTLSDSLTGSSVRNSNINSVGGFSWTPSSADAGLHSITVTASDSSGHSANTSVSIQVSASTVLVPLSSPTSAVPMPAPSVSPMTTYSGSPLTVLQIQAVAAVLQAFGVSQSMIAQVFAILSASQVASTVASTVAPSPSASGSKYVFTSFLTVGSSGIEVSELQKKLAAEGFFSGTITNSFGTLTEEAVKKYQIAHGITAAGFVGPATRVVLNAK